MPRRVGLPGASELFRSTTAELNEAADGVEALAAIQKTVPDVVVADLFMPRLDGAEPDDLLDACAACWSARRIAEGRAESLPREPHSDARGLRMQIWY